MSGTQVPEPTVRITHYEVSCLPEGHMERSYLSVQVEYRGRGLWAVARNRRCYDAEGNPDWEPLPSERTDEWMARFRHDLDTALELAKRIAPTLKINGLTVADLLAREVQR